MSSDRKYHLLYHQQAVSFQSLQSFAALIRRKTTQTIKTQLVGHRNANTLQYLIRDTDRQTNIWDLFFYKIRICVGITFSKRRMLRVMFPPSALKKKKKPSALLHLFKLNTNAEGVYILQRCMASSSEF